MNSTVTTELAVSAIVPDDHHIYIDRRTDSVTRIIIIIHIVRTQDLPVNLPMPEANSNILFPSYEGSNDITSGLLL